MVRRVATDPKTGFTGVVLVASFAISRTPMAVFSTETALPWPSGCWKLSVMVKTEGGHERAVRRGAVRKNPNPNKYERASCRTHLVRGVI